MDSIYEKPVTPNSSVELNSNTSQPQTVAYADPPPDPTPEEYTPPPQRPRLILSIIVTMIVLVLAAGVGFMLGREHPDESLLVPVATPTAIPSGPTATPTSPPSTGIKFEGEFIKFTAPSDWTPADIEPQWGEVNEKVVLGIPLHTGDQSMTFLTLSTPYDKPTYVFEESTITIGGLEAIKWKGRGDTFASYDYVTKTPSKNGLFSLHVTSEKESPILEQQLDDLVKTIVFKPE